MSQPEPTPDRHYLDHAAGSPVSAAVAAVITDQLVRAGNPSSLHAEGRHARRVVEDARESMAADLGCRPSEVVLTSGGTEADNLIMVGGARARRDTRPRVIASATEHPAVIDTLASIRDDGGDPQLITVDRDGRIDHDQLGDLLQAPTAVVSVQWVNNETGVINPPTDWTERVRSAGAWAHADAVQALGAIDVDFAASGLDAMTVSAHKLGGPVGVGALVLRRELEPAPTGFGGRQERGLRSGTVPVALAAGFAAAVRQAVSVREETARRHGRWAERLIVAAGGLDGVHLHGAGADRSPSIVNLGFDGLRAADLLMLLDRAGIDCSTGSACTAGVPPPSEVLLAMGYDEARAAGALRFSFGWSTTDADLEALIAALPDSVDRARLAHG